MADKIEIPYKKDYFCPFCSLFSSYTKKKVIKHLAVCRYNPNLPEKDCHTCEYRYPGNIYCRKHHDMIGLHYGYNACADYAKKNM